MDPTTYARSTERIRHQRSHWDVPYEIWEAGQSWLWLVVAPACKSGATGAAATADQAAHDACRAIEELCPESCLARADASPPQATKRCDLTAYLASGWDACFNRLQLYLRRLDSAAV